MYDLFASRYLTFNAPVDVPFDPFSTSKPDGGNAGAQAARLPSLPLARVADTKKAGSPTLRGNGLGGGHFQSAAAETIHDYGRLTFRGIAVGGAHTLVYSSLSMKRSKSTEATTEADEDCSADFPTSRMIGQRGGWKVFIFL